MKLETQFELLMAKQIVKKNHLNPQQRAIMSRAIREYEPVIRITKNETMSQLQKIVSDFYICDVTYFDTHSRETMIVYGRHIIWYFTEIYFKIIPLKARGLHFGLDHATALHGYYRIREEVKVNKQLQVEILELDRLIRREMKLENRIQYRHF